MDAARPLRLLTVSNFFDSHRGGLEIVAGQLARQLAGKGFDVTWLATKSTPPPTEPGRVRAVSVGAWNVTERRLGVPFPFLGLGAIGRLVREIRRSDAVLLHDSLYPISMVTAVAARLSRRPLVVIQHIGQVPYRNPVLRLMMAAANRCVARPLLARASQVVFISAFVRAFFSGVRFARPPELIFNGVDAETFRPGDRAAARQHLGLDPSASVALFVGRFVDKKGLHLLQRMARSRPGIQWVFAGWGVIDPTAWGLANVKVYSDLSGPGLAQLYQAADLFVLPSQGEGFPLVIQEALAWGLPVICGAETAAADGAASPFLEGVALDEADPDLSSERFAAVVDQVLARLPSETDAPERRRALALGRDAWSAAADRYADIVHRLVQAPAAVARPQDLGHPAPGGAA